MQWASLQQWTAFETEMFDTREITKETLADIGNCLSRGLEEAMKAVPGIGVSVRFMCILDSERNPNGDMGYFRVVVNSADARSLPPVTVLPLKAASDAQTP